MTELTERVGIASVSSNPALSSRPPNCSSVRSAPPATISMFRSSRPPVASVDVRHHLDHVKRTARRHRLPGPGEDADRVLVGPVMQHPCQHHCIGPEPATARRSLSAANRHRPFKIAAEAQLRGPPPGGPSRWPSGQGKRGAGQRPVLRSRRPRRGYDLCDSKVASLPPMTGSRAGRS